MRKAIIPVLAFGLVTFGGCQKNDPAATPTAAATAAAEPAATPSVTPSGLPDAGPTSSAFSTPTPDDETIVQVNMVRGYVTLYVNDQSVGKFGKEGILGGEPGEGLGRQSIKPLVRPGLNSLRVAWSEETPPIGEVHVSYSAGDGYREIATFKMDPTSSQATGDQKIDFSVPDSKTSAPTGTPTPGGTPQTAASQQTPAQAGPGSRAKQTLMTVNLTKGNATVWINGNQVGSYSAGLLPLDVSDKVKSGENKMKVTWTDSTPPLGSVEISYATEPSKFATVANFEMNVFSKAGTNEPAEVTFTLP